MKDNRDYQPIIDILIQLLGEYKSHNELKGQISFDCPVCSYEIKGLSDGDGKGNLEVNYYSNVFKCWSCSETHETHGSVFKLIKTHGNNKLLKRYQLLRPESDSIAETKKKQYIQLPKEFTPLHNVSNGIKLLPQYKQAHGYLKSRNINDDLIKKFNIGFCRNGYYENRIIIPSYDKNNYLNYFIGRSYLSNPKLKYLNPVAQKELIIFNEKFINWNDTVYLVEGAFDSIFINNSIPLLGKIMSEYLHNVLYQNANQIVIVFDPDAWDNAQIVYHKLNCGKLMGKVSIIQLLGNQDVADLQGILSGYEPKKID